MAGRAGEGRWSSSCRCSSGVAGRAPPVFPAVLCQASGCQVLAEINGNFAKVASSGFCFFGLPLGVTPDFSAAYVLDEWPDSRSQGEEYSFQAFV